MNSKFALDDLVTFKKMKSHIYKVTEITKMYLRKDNKNEFVQNEEMPESYDQVVFSYALEEVDFLSKRRINLITEDALEDCLDFAASCNVFSKRSLRKPKQHLQTPPCKKIVHFNDVTEIRLIPGNITTDEASYRNKLIKQYAMTLLELKRNEIV